MKNFFFVMNFDMVIKLKKFKQICFSYDRNITRSALITPENSMKVKNGEDPESVFLDLYLKRLSFFNKNPTRATCFKKMKFCFVPIFGYNNSGYNLDVFGYNKTSLINAKCLIHSVHLLIY